MLNLNQTTFSVFLVTITGMIKVGYILIELSFYYLNIFDSYYSSYYYKQIAAFSSGMIIPLLLHLKVSRCMIVTLAELFFSALMIIIPFANTDVRLYGFLIGGGIGILLYPIYAREYFLQNQQMKHWSFIWSFLGIGIIYYCCMNQKNISQFNQISLLSTDEFTPYLFGSISILNVLLLFLQKHKETLFYYAQKQKHQELQDLIKKIYKDQYQEDILEGFQYGYNLQNLPLIENESTTSLHDKEIINKQQIIILFILAFCAGGSRIFFTFLYLTADISLILNPNDENILEELTKEQYILYLVIIIISILGGCIALIKKVKMIGIYNYGLSFIISVILIIKNESSFQSLFYNYIGILQFISLFGFVAPIIFVLPFRLLSIDKIFLYYAFLWIGSVINKIFINNSKYVDNTGLHVNYNSTILATIFQLIGTIALYFIKNFQFYRNQTTI